MMFIVLKKIYLTSRHLAGKENALGRTSTIQIVSHPGEKGFHLQYLDSSGKDFSSTYHRSVDSAIQQTSLDFDVTIDEWDCQIPFRRSDKRRIYALIDSYLSSKISALDFCDEFHSSYGMDLNLESLSDTERSVFSSLDEVSGRFSPYNNDHEKHPGVYFTEDELKEKVISSRNALDAVVKK